MTGDMWHMTRDTWHVTRDTWHMTHDTLGGMNILSKFQLPSSYCFFCWTYWTFWNQEIGKNYLWHMTCDTWHVTCDTWHMTRDTWHVTCDMYGGVNILSKFQLPSSYCLIFMILWRYWGKGSLTDSMNQSVTRLFIEQPRLHRVC